MSSLFLLRTACCLKLWVFVLELSGNIGWLEEEEEEEEEAVFTRESITKEDAPNAHLGCQASSEREERGCGRKRREREPR